MSQKVEITKLIMRELEIEPTPKNIKQCLIKWWQSPRKKAEKGFWLSTQGFETFKQAGIKNYLITFEEPIQLFENKFIIWLDNSIECPFYITKKEIIVFGERTAVQLMLMSGNIKLWHKINTKNA